MKEVFWKTFALLLVLVLPVASFGAETLKLRHALSVYSDDKGVGMKYPEGVACCGDFLLVADTGNNRLLSYTLREDSVKGGAEFAAPQFSNPLRVKKNSKGEIFVLDGKQRRIIRLGRDGTFAGYLDAAGLPAPELIIPRDFDIDSKDNIYILDILSSRVLMLSPEGKYVRQIPFPKNYGFLSGIAVTGKGDVLVVDSVRASAFSAKKDSDSFTLLAGGLKEYMSFPVSIASDTSGNMYVVDHNVGGVVILGADGSYKGRQLRTGWKEGDLRYPAGICLNGQGIMAVADRENSRIQLFKVESK